MEFSDTNSLPGKPQNWQPCTKDSVNCDFEKWGKDYLRPECCTNHLKELLFFTEHLLTKHGILHWLDFGCLLGAVRNQEMIPWDNGIDFSFLKRDSDKMCSLEDEVNRAGYHFVSDEDHFCWRIRFSKTNELGVHLSPWREDGGLLKRRNLWKRIPDQSFPLKYLENLEPVNLYGKSFPAPSPLHDFLVHHRYGPDYMIPQRETWVLYSIPNLNIRDLTPLVSQLLEEIRERDYIIQQFEGQHLPNKNLHKEQDRKQKSFIGALNSLVRPWYHSGSKSSRLAQSIHRGIYWERRHIRWAVVGRLALVLHKLGLDYLMPKEITLNQLPTIRPDEFTLVVAQLLYTIRLRDARIQELQARFPETKQASL